MTIQIRPATLADYSSIESIARESQDLHAAAHPAIFQHDISGISAEYLRRLIEGEKFAACVAEEDGYIVGYCFMRAYQLSYLEIFQPNMVAEINDIAITALARGRGIGRLLFETAQQWAKSHNAVRLELTVWEFNSNAIAFYERLGMNALSRTMAISLE